MALSPELQALQDRQTTYQGNLVTSDYISDKYLGMIIGPTGVGKSTIVDKVIELEPEWDIAGTRTTRDRKPEDPPHYQTGSEGVTIEKMKNEIINGELVNYSINKNGQIYGTPPEEFRARYNLLPVLTDSIATLQRAGFSRTDSMYIFSPAEQWRARIESSRTGYSDIRPRLEEGITSIEYALENISQLHFIENTHGQEGINKAARKVISIVNKQFTDDDLGYVSRSLEDMLAVAKDLAVH